MRPFRVRNAIAVVLCLGACWLGPPAAAQPGPAARRKPPQDRKTTDSVLLSGSVASGAWERGYQDVIRSLHATSDGGAVMATGAGALMRIDASGKVLWHRTLADRGVKHVAVLPDGALLVAGNVKKAPGSCGDARQGETVYGTGWFLQKTSAAGKVLFDRQPLPCGELVAMIPLRSGGVVLAGSGRAGSEDRAMVLRTDVEGKVAWSRELALHRPRRVEGVDQKWLMPHAVVEHSDGSIWVGGRGRRTDSDAGAYIVRLSGDGKPLSEGLVGWVDDITTLAVDGDGVLAAGKGIDGKPPEQRTVLLRARPDGTRHWGKYHLDNSEGRGMVPTRDGHVVVAGYSAVLGGGGGDALVVKLRRDGTLLWQKAFGDHEREEAFAVVELPDGALLVGGALGKYDDATRTGFRGLLVRIPADGGK